MIDLYSYETAMARRGFTAVCGLDEAGCGPLAGPVYAAAVVLNPADPIPGINDSKKLSQQQRETLYDAICARALAWSVAWVEADEIDRINILEARLLAMRQAAAGLSLTPHCALVDGNRDPRLPWETLLIHKGDQLSASIGAASVVAKVSRDRHMVAMSALYPQYAFERHKGYPTKHHYALLDTYGPSPIHRVSFLRKWQTRREVAV